MLRRIDALRDSGIFKDYRWSTGCPEFARVNVIYGGNGSGKSCLAQAFDLACTEPGKRSRLRICVDDSGTTRPVAEDAEVFDRILVFDVDYITRNHRFRGTDSPDMEAILTIGQRSSEAEDRLAALSQKAGELGSQADVQSTCVAELTKKRTELLTKISVDIVADLTRFGGSYQSRSNYTVAVAENKLRGSRDGWKTLDVKQLASNREVVNAPKQDAVAFENHDLSVSDDLVEETKRVLGATASTVVLDTLAKHPDASQWVQQGRALHDSLDQCIFCGSPLTNERRRQIDQHFSGEVELLESSIRTVTSRLDDLASAVKSCRESVPPRSALYEDLRETYDTACTGLKDELSSLEGWIGKLGTRLAKKLTNVLRADNEEVVAPPTVDCAPIDEVVTQHNARAASHGDHVKEAALCIERHHLSASAKEYDKVNKEIDEANALINSIRSDLSAVNNEIASLGSSEGDPTPSASVLNSEVARLLGRAELSFRPVGSRYQVLRNGEPAVGLSEGECTAITLLHFMEAVARHKSSGKPPIVITDDPVSSLDSSVFLGVSTYIWSECITKERAAQLFLLTHNFELFRQWDIQLEGLGHSSRKTDFPSQLYQLISCHEARNGVTARCPVLAEWPPPGVSPQKVRSSYVHAFMTVAEAKRKLDECESLEHQLDAQLLVPNVMRRLLEGFIGFKRPDFAGKFDSAMRECGAMLTSAGYGGDAEALRLQLTRFAHAYSHSENPDVTVVVDPSEIRPALGAVFEFMDAIDSEHMKGLCKVANIPYESLVNVSGSADSALGV